MNVSVATQSCKSSAESQPMIGIVDDDPIMGESLAQRLQLEGYRTKWWRTGEEALCNLRDTGCGVLVCDIRLPDLDGEQLFWRAVPDLGSTPVIFITAYGRVEQAVRLMRAGADDYITKPFEVGELLRKIADLCARGTTADNGSQDQGMLNTSPTKRAVEFKLLRVKDMDKPVLLLGETGVGKEIMARQMHDASARREMPFVVVNCATIPAGRMETEMFGHEGDAATGPSIARVGLVEQAKGGTLFLDEVSALPTLLQGKLLRLLEDGSYRKVGGAARMVSNARVVSSSTADLPTLVVEGCLRADLYYRLNVIAVHIPPLCARREEIVLLAEHYLAQIAHTAGRRVPLLTPAARIALREHGWPGNDRELRNRLERALGLSPNESRLQAQAIFPGQVLLDEPGKSAASSVEAREGTECLNVEETMRRTVGTIGKSAAILSLSRTNLRRLRRLFRGGFGY
jgi:DNA-binding NtrC family response regulator